MKPELSIGIICLLLTFGLTQTANAQNKNVLIVTPGEDGDAVTLSLSDAPVISFSKSEGAEHNDQLTITVGEETTDPYSIADLTSLSFAYVAQQATVTLNQDPENTDTYYATFSNASAHVVAAGAGVVPYFAVNESTDDDAVVISMEAIAAEDDGSYILEANTGYLLRATNVEGGAPTKTVTFDVADDNTTATVGGGGVICSFPT